jgi:hypothetical protein
MQGCSPRSLNEFGPVVIENDSKRLWGGLPIPMGRAKSEKVLEKVTSLDIKSESEHDQKLIELAGICEADTVKVSGTFIQG